MPSGIHMAMLATSRPLTIPGPSQSERIRSRSSTRAIGTTKISDRGAIVATNPNAFTHTDASWTTGACSVTHRAGTTTRSDRP
jgi:hypothetical protein